MSAAALYTPEVLDLATRLSRWPVSDDLALHGRARSPTCGSEVSLGLALDGSGRIERIGMRVTACAIGQAAAALFAEAATGLVADEIAASEAELRRWLGGQRTLPDWPGLQAIAAAQGYPGRHGAVMLAWRAATAALSSG